MNFAPELIDFYRANPVLAAKYILNVNLCEYQAEMLEGFWFHRNSLWCCSRGAAKTFTAAVGLTLLGILYKGIKIGVTSGSIPQACEIFVKIDEIALNAPLLAQEISEPIHWTEKDGGRVKFKTGSWIQVFPLISRRRGKRLNALFIDEYRECDEKLVKTVAMPMLNIKDTEIDNKVLICSTATYTSNVFYAKVKEFERMIQQKNRDYFMCTFDVNDVKTSGFLDEQKVKNDMATMLPEEIEQEYMAKFTDLNAGFINGAAIRGAEIEYKPKLKGDPDKEYIAGIDNARAEGGDSSFYVVFEINPMGVILVYAKALNGVPFPQQARLLRKLCFDFNIIKMRMDFDMAGKAIQDLLVNDMMDLETGKPLPMIVCVDDFEHTKALQIIENVKFKQQDFVLSMGMDVKRAIQEKSLLFPKNEYQIAMSEEEEMVLPEYDREQLDLHRNIQRAKCELANIKQRPNEAGNSFQFVTDSPKINKKDGGMAIFMGGSAAYEYWKGLSANHGDESIGVVC